MKKKFSFSWFLLIISCFSGLSLVAFSKAIDPTQGKNRPQKGGHRVLMISAGEPGLKSITFTAGNIPCKDNNGVSVGTPHWENQSPAIVRPTAVVKGGTLTTKLVFEMPEIGPEWKGKVKILNVRYYGSNGSPGFTLLDYTQPTDTITIFPSGTESVSFSIGSFPNIVHRGATVDIQCQLIETPDPETGNLHRDPIVEGNPKVYEVYATPNAPQSTPWLGVLDDACEWAHGESAEAGVSRTVTLQLNQGGVFNYVYSPQFLSNSSFKLKTFLATGRPTSGNCVDVSDYLAIGTNALGLNFSVRKIYCQNGFGTNGNTWTTNSLRPIGWSNFMNINWTMHQIAHPPVINSVKVYDPTAALELDTLGNTWAKAEYDWDLDTYWQNGGNGLVYSPNPAVMTDSGALSVSIVAQ
nr:hypothetical protein [Armatimonas sp.]